MRKCGNCGAGIVGNAATCGYCTLSYNSTDNAARTPMKSEEAMRIERDSRMYLKAARYSGIALAIFIVIVVIVVIADVNTESFFVKMLNVICSVSMYAGIIFFIIGKIKKKKAEGMK